VWVRFKSKFIAPARDRCDLSTCNRSLMKTNTDTIQKLYIGLDVYKEKTSVVISEPDRKGEFKAGEFMVSCSGSSEAKTRTQQEAEFTNAFGFSPPATITTITYSDFYMRGFVDCSYDEWMSFSFDQASFDQIILGRSKNKPHSDLLEGRATPAWWPKAIPNSTVMFTRSQDDAPANEGFYFRESIWHDRASGLVFYHKNYWD
jgi:hypothetical protein